MFWPHNVTFDWYWENHLHVHIAFVIFQYLEFSNFDKALVVFDEECSEKGKPVSPTDGQPKSDEKLISVQVIYLSTKDVLHQYLVAEHLLLTTPKYQRKTVCLIKSHHYIDVKFYILEWLHNIRREIK